MKITCVGVGYVGLVTSVCLADQGNDVIGLDVDQKKINNLEKGIIPIYEPGLKDVLDRNQKEGRITFTTDQKKAYEGADAIFISVGTPSKEDGSADLKHVLAVCEAIGKNMTGYTVVIDKSTVPVGTAAIVKKTIQKHQPTPTEFDVASNPEFLREGEAVTDFTIPDRIIVGSDSEKAKRVLEKIYRGIARTDHPLVFTDIKSAELIKYASNAFLATKISFINEISHLCERVGADVKEVAKGMGLDERIGPRFLQAGLGFGGSCFPKDVSALIHTMKNEGCDAWLLDAVEKVNHHQKVSVLPKIKELVGDVKDKTIGIWGLAFKPKTDDMREAPSIVIIEELQKMGAKIKAFDPVAEQVAQSLLKDVDYCPGPYEAITGADALVIVTEWNEFRSLNKERIKGVMKKPIIIDGRNVYDPKEMRELGFSYVGVGR